MDALRFFEEDTTWWSLRKTYDAIEKDFGGQQNQVARNLTISLDEIKRFKEWASHYVHGELEPAPDPQHHPGLSLGDAEAFVQNILMTWLRWKQRSGGNAR